MQRSLAALFLCVPGALFAAGGETPQPPAPTETTERCTDGQVWSGTKQSCVSVQSGQDSGQNSGALDDAALFGAAREFAYAGQYQHALGALAAMSDPSDDRVLTYKGFVHRKLGDPERGNRFYRQALAANPDNHLARSYMGQGFVAEGDFAAAWAALREIRARGGSGTWAEASLAEALETGTGHNY